MNRITVNSNQTVVINENKNYNIEVTANCHVDLVLHYQSDINTAVEIVVQENAVLNVIHHYDSTTIQENQTYHIQKGAEVKIVYAHLSPKMNAKQKIEILLVGEHSKVEIASGILAKENIQIDMNVEHRAKNSYANMEHYAVVSNHAHFKLYAQGKICEKMSGSQAHQTTCVLTMAKEHHCEVTPVLVIDENDVAASHANSIGQPDDLQLYYLQSRGLTIQQALNLISSGYLEPMVLLLEETSLHDTIVKLIEEKVA